MKFWQSETSQTKVIIADFFLLKFFFNPRCLGSLTGQSGVNGKFKIYDGKMWALPPTGYRLWNGSEIIENSKK